MARGSSDSSSQALDRIVAEARRSAEQREKGYRERALKMYPWICGRCAREFTRANLTELTVHHRNHNHDDNPADGSNWELLCVYCHDNEHSRLIDWTGSSAQAAEQAPEAATAGERFDDLVTIADVTGAVHCHTTYSDGKSSIAQMALAAEERELAFLTVTDHSHSAHYAGGLDDARLRAQWREIEAAQASTPVRLVRGTESDILADGRLDFAGETLAELELVIASVHNRHQLDEDAMTQRLVTAMRQPIFKIWGHALGRLVLRRDPLPCRFDDVLDAIVESPAAIEINGDPNRLDLDPVRVRRAHARGIRFVLSSDAHSAADLDYLENAVAMARRARLRPKDVLNTLPTDEFLAAVRPAR